MHLEVPSRWADAARTARTYARWPGTDRVVPWFRKYLRKRVEGEITTVLVWAGSAAMSLVPALERLNNDPKLGQLEIVVVPESQAPAACGHVVDAVAQELVVHVGDPELQASMLAVGKRMVGDKAFVWSPRSSSATSLRRWPRPDRPAHRAGRRLRHRGVGRVSIADVFEAAGWVAIAAAPGWLLALSVPAPFGIPCGCCWPARCSCCWPMCPTGWCPGALPREG